MEYHVILSPSVTSLKVIKIKKYCLHLSGSHSLYIQVTAHCLCQLKIVISRFNFGVETHL